MALLVHYPLQDGCHGYMTLTLPIACPLRGKIKGLYRVNGFHPLLCIACPFDLSLSLSLSHTHTHTHTHSLSLSLTLTPPDGPQETYEYLPDEVEAQN